MHHRGSGSLYVAPELWYVPKTQAITREEVAACFRRPIIIVPSRDGVPCRACDLNFRVHERDAE